MIFKIKKKYLLIFIRIYVYIYIYMYNMNEQYNMLLYQRIFGPAPNIDLLI